MFLTTKKFLFNRKALLGLGLTNILWLLILAKMLPLGLVLFGLSVKLFFGCILILGIQKANF